MKVLYIGGTGVISTDAARLSVSRGQAVFMLNRGRHAEWMPEGATLLRADASDAEALRAALGSHCFDVAVDCISYTPGQLGMKLEALRGRVGQYVFISSAAVYGRGYQREVGWSVSGGSRAEDPVIREDATPTMNFGWDYARDKIACEHELIREQRLHGTRFTIVRPSETYNDLRIPAVIVPNPFYALVARMRAGKSILVHDDGMAKMTVTHAADLAKGLVGLFGNPRADGQAFHITSGESMTWLDLSRRVAEAAGCEPNLCYIPSDALIRLLPRTPHGNTYGVIGCAKRFDCLYDNAKIRAAVPDFRCEIPFEAGIRRTLAFYEAHPAYCQTGPAWDAEMDRVIAEYRAGGEALP